MLKVILLAVVAVVVVFAVIVAMRPSDFRVARSARIAAPPDVVFAQVNDLHKWEAWSPWAKIDPAAKTSYAGPAAGTGASFAWSGNNNLGEGRMTISESRPSDLIRFSLEFLRPFKGNSTAEFTFKPDGNETVVTWAMSGKNHFIAKAIGLFINCDKMVGCQFEKGLADLKGVAESAPKVETAAAQ
jgi:hypothetical protein